MVEDGVAAHFDELAGLLSSARSGPPDPDRVVRFATAAVPHSEHCGLTLVRGRGRPVTIAWSGELSRDVDAIQYATGEGPCLEASNGSDVVLVGDLAVDRRWPVFARRCVAETGVRSMFGVRLALAGEDRAALNFYAHRPDAFHDLDVGVGAIFAPFAALAVQNTLHEQEAEQLRTALRSSRQIGTAIGILMAQQLVTSGEAYGQLVSSSQHLNRKLRDIAAEVERTGVLPDPA